MLFFGILLKMWVKFQTQQGGPEKLLSKP